MKHDESLLIHAVQCQIKLLESQPRPPKHALKMYRALLSKLLAVAVLSGCGTWRTNEEIANAPIKPEPIFTGLSHLKRRPAPIDQAPPCTGQYNDPEPHNCR